MEDPQADSPCFQGRKTDDEQKVRERRIAIVDSELDRKATVEKFRVAINGFREHNQTTLQSLDVQLIEDRIHKVILCSPQ